jgi:para-aminobenzoate synthetase
MLQVQTLGTSGLGILIINTLLHIRHDHVLHCPPPPLCRALYDGDSYEVCLTTALVRQGAPDPPTLYRTLRAVNPAPYAAWFHVSGSQGPIICCSSPERFLRGGRGGLLEARPIKGTAARVHGDPAADAAAAAALAGSEKDRAENLMIVDLLRNDLGSVCEVGSLAWPSMSEVPAVAFA